MKTKNYDIIDVEILLFNDTDIIEEFNKQTILFKTELIRNKTAKSPVDKSVKLPEEEYNKTTRRKIRKKT